MIKQGQQIQIRRLEEEQQISDLGFVTAFRMERVKQEERNREAERFLQEQFG